MRTIRRRWAAALVIALGLGAVSACSVKSDTGGDGASGGKEITFLVFETPNLTPQVWDANIKRVTDRYPDIKVKKIVSPTEDRTAYAKQLLTSGQFPDVLVAVSPTGFAEAGKLYAWKPDELKQFTHPNQGAVNGQVYQLPANTQTIPVMYYNKDLFAKAGLSGPPKNYAEFLDDCAKLKAKGIKPLVVGGGHDALGPTWAGVLGTEVYARSPNWMHDRRAGKVKFTGPEFMKGAQKLADLAAKGYIDKRDLALDYPKTQQAFLDGKGAMYAMGNWFAAAADNPETKPDFGVGQFFWPTDDGRQVVPAFTGGGLLVSSAAKNLEAAKKFALAYQLDKTNLDTSAVSDGLIPAVKGYTPPAKAGSVYQDGYRQYGQAAQAGAVVPAFGFESGDDGMPAGVVDKWDSAAQDLVTGRRTAQEVAKFLDTEWSKAS